MLALDLTDLVSLKGTRPAVGASAAGAERSATVRPERDVRRQFEFGDRGRSIAGGGYGSGRIGPR